MVKMTNLETNTDLQRKRKETTQEDICMLGPLILTHAKLQINLLEMCRDRYVYLDNISGHVTTKISHYHKPEVALSC